MITIWYFEEKRSRINMYHELFLIMYVKHGRAGVVVPLRFWWLEGIKARLFDEVTIWKYKRLRHQWFPLPSQTSNVKFEKLIKTVVSFVSLYILQSQMLYNLGKTGRDWTS